MGCLFAVFAGAFPRLADLFLWLARPALFMAPFGGSWLWPMLGVIFLPFSTLMYVFMWSPVTGLYGWDWFWLGLAVLLDVSSMAANVRTNRDRLPGYNTNPT